MDELIMFEVTFGIIDAPNIRVWVKALSIKTVLDQIEKAILENKILHFERELVNPHSIAHCSVK